MLSTVPPLNRAQDSLFAGVDRASLWSDLIGNKWQEHMTAVRR